MFRPVRPLAVLTTYTVTIKKNIKDIYGSGLAEDSSWSLTTGRINDTVPPRVLFSNPVSNSNSAPANTAITVNFSEPVDPASVTTSTLIVSGPGGPVAGTINVSGITATFTPAANFSYLTTYTITASQGIKDLAGNPLSAVYGSTFSTSAAPDVTPPTMVSISPADAATGVDAYTPITITFSEAVNPATVTTGTITVSGGGGAVAGTVATNQNVATFTPSAALQSGTIYTVVVKTGIRDLAGNPLPGNYTLSFTIAGTSSGNSGLFLDYQATQTGSWPEAVAIGDVNGDGRNDVVLVTSYYFDPANDYKVFVFLQNADGTLAAPIKYATSGTYTSPPDTVAIGDVNHDGKNDVVIGNSGGNIEVFLQNASGGLNPGVTYASTDTNKIKIADLNHDGLMDVVGIGWGTNTVSIWYQNAGGTLNPPVSYAVTHGGYDDLDVGDVNNDGLTDIVVMSGQSLIPNIGVLTQKSDGTFNAPVYYSLGSSILSHGVAVGDITGDSLQDIVITYGGNSPSSHIGVFSQDTKGLLNPVVSYQSYDCPEPIEIADVDNDGRKDILVLHGGWNALGVYLQMSDGTLKAEERYDIPYASHYNPHGLAVGDINGDGKKDVVIADYNSGLVVLYHK